MKATAKDLRFYSKELLKSANRGEEIIITYRGKPYAKLVPLDYKDKHSVKEDDELYGIWKDHEISENVDDYIRNLRKKRY